MQIKPGAKAPADGEVTDGASHVDESMITGESAPVSKRPGSPIISGAYCIPLRMLPPPPLPLLPTASFPSTGVRQCNLEFQIWTGNPTIFAQAFLHCLTSASLPYLTLSLPQCILSKLCPDSVQHRRPLALKRQDR